MSHSASGFLGIDSISRWHLASIGNPIVEIKPFYDRLISTMGFPILVRHLYIESEPRFWSGSVPQATASLVVNTSHPEAVHVNTVMYLKQSQGTRPGTAVRNANYWVGENWALCNVNLGRTLSSKNADLYPKWPKRLYQLLQLISM